MNITAAQLNLEITFRMHVVRAAVELSALQSARKLLFPRRGQPAAALKRLAGAELSLEQERVWQAFRVPRAREAEAWAWRGVRTDLVVGCLNFVASPAISTPAAAVRALFQGVLPIQCECQTAMRLAALKAIVDTFGDAAFNALAAERGPGLRIGGGHDPVVYSALKLESPTSLLVAGDLVAFSNPDASDETWRYENAVYLGNDPSGEQTFFAHPFGITSAAKIIGQLQKKRRAGSRASAFLATLIYPSFSYMPQLPAHGLYKRYEEEWLKRER